MHRAAFPLAILATCLAAARVHAADAVLIAAAKAERQVVWYTTQAVIDLVEPLVRGFEAKYGIKVSYTRNSATELVLKVTNEARANRREVDVVDGTFSVAALKRAGIVLKWLPEAAKAFPKDLVDAEGFWVATNIYVATPAINTDLVPKGAEPKTLTDLLDPRWKNKMVWSVVPGSATGAGFIAAVLKQEGEAKTRAYLGELAKQNIAGLAFPARTVLDQVIAGEYAMILQNFNSQAVVAARKGAPVKWITLSPASVVLTGASVVKDSPHPNAAKLLLDYLVSDEGQKIFRDSDYVPADPKVPARDASVRPDGANMRAEYFTPEEVDARMPEWSALFKEYFR